MHRNRVRPAADTPTHPPPPRHRARISKIHHSYPTPIRSWGRHVEQEGFLSSLGVLGCDQRELPDRGRD
ncbi:hypothetical protein PC115_g22250 [Phytophthora cactorum]|uniref:Uncharacterized protein n=1 Tax=Phytophthora cactorum TaxID=29920 RepID=A0A8T1AJZ3_9STRA|nr:hypothetical protein PC115_g22250 [Phytophthora cactorum]